MKLSFIEEPELEFGNGGTHVDIRYGLSAYGPLDVGEATAPNQLRVGLVGTEETVAALRAWLEKCASGIPAKQSKLSNLFPAFPGFSDSSAFKSSLVFHDRWCSFIRQRELESVVSQSGPDDIVRHAVDLFLDHVDGILEQGGPMVLMCLPPTDLLAAVDEGPAEMGDADKQELDEGSEPPSGRVDRRPFHDVLKAQGMRLTIPIQMVRPHTYTGVQREPRARRRKPRKSSMTMQDEATRAWNIHTALYYKAGGIPWRLLRESSDLSTCFVGISFFKSADGERLMTSVAQVFNERGEGVIVKGGNAKLDKNDRQPHLSEEDATTLLKAAIQVYRREHRNNPARIVVQKTSKLTLGEQAGFTAAADDHDVDVVDLLAVRRSFTRLFREGTYPPLRGTFMEIEANAGLLYTRGSVPFFQSYPGMYVPRPLEISIARAESTASQLATEMLALSKLNWNNTQFDGGEPITVRAARRVGDILKCVPEGGHVQPGFRFFM